MQNASISVHARHFSIKTNDRYAYYWFTVHVMFAHSGNNYRGKPIIKNHWLENSSFLIDNWLYRVYLSCICPIPPHLDSRNSIDELFSVWLFSRPLNDKVTFNRVQTNRFVEQFLLNPKKGRKEKKKGKEDEEGKKKTEQMIESSFFSIGESRHDEHHVFPLSVLIMV